jgi:peptidoglycan/LPS O-acetylase OafA/YrhL
VSGGGRSPRSVVLLLEEDAEQFAYVVLAFVGQAMIGGAFVASTLVPRWIAWATVLWNVCWLAGLVLARPQDVYFPVLHLVMPVFIGVALIQRSRLGTPPVSRWRRRRAVPGRQRDAVGGHTTATSG